MDLRPDWISLSRSADSSIMLSALRQIGDVVLVHDESAANDSGAIAATWGAVDLIGTALETEDGVHLGKVHCTQSALLVVCCAQAVHSSRLQPKALTRACAVAGQGFYVQPR